MKTLSIVIKALNEEANIARAIESSLATAAAVDGEVILADSLSDDRTTAIAAKYPITIAQLRRTGDRACGAGPQLGFQHATGRYIYLLDGDMELNPDFVVAALEAIESAPRIAGVGGNCEEVNATMFDARRRAAYARHGDASGDVDRLNGGGLYRREAVEDVGYFSDRNLHSYEEFDLGARLRKKGWRLVRLDMRSTYHYGHTMNSFKVLLERVRSRYFLGIGEVTRAAFLGGYIRETMAALPELRLMALVVAAWLATIAIAATQGPAATAAAMAALVVLPVAYLAARRRSLSFGLYALTWHVYALGFVIGLLRPRRPPTGLVDSTVTRGGSADLPGAGGLKLTA